MPAAPCVVHGEMHLGIYSFFFLTRVFVAAVAPIYAAEILPKTGDFIIFMGSFNNGNVQCLPDSATSGESHA